MSSNWYVPKDYNISLKEYHKISKDLEIEIEKMCHLITTFMSVIVEALRMIKKETDKHMKKILGNLNINMLFAELFILG